MKRIVFIVAFFTASFANWGYGQQTRQTVLSQLLSDYYNIKNALVSGNAVTASVKAGDFIKTINGVDYKMISEGNVNILLKDAGKIAGSKDVNRQREYFSNFSGNMIAVAKAVKLGDKETYVQYCPMKKASWLSSEKAIKNPYYGAAMLTCGEVTETIK